MTTSPDRRPVRRALLIAATLAAATTVLAAAPAGAVAVTGTGTSLSFSGEVGDYISQGQTLALDPTTATFSVTADGDHGLSFFVDGSTWWTGRLTAPTGKSLVAGSTFSTERFETPAAGTLDLGGDGRGCNQTFGEVTVKTATFGPHGWIEDLDVTFVQHCESPDAPALTGELRLTNGPAPVELAVKVTPFVNAKVVKVSGRAVISGSVTCNRPALVDLSGELAQRRTRTALAAGTWSASQIRCGSTPVKWSASVRPSGAVPFGTGQAEVTATWAAQDDAYQIPLSGTATRLVTLKV